MHTGVTAKQKEKLLLLTHNNISKKIEYMKSAVKYGATLSKDLNMLQAELLKLEQKTGEIDISLGSLYSVLSELTGDKYSDSTQFFLPVFNTNLQIETSNRLENQLFSLNKEMLRSSRNLIDSKGMPVIAGFGQAGYGKPGLNMLSDGFDDYYMFGIGLNWNLWNWKKFKKEKQTLDLEHQMIETQQESFNTQLTIELIQKQSEIFNYQKMIKEDEEIIRLRSEIAKTASSHLDNGVITSTEYITELNAETAAKLNLEIHRIFLVKSRVDFAHAKGEAISESGN